MSEELESIGRIRTLASWLKRTGKTTDQYPLARREAMTAQEREEAEQFANGRLPWPSKWTSRLYHLARDN